jgi:hypothetical protein
LAVDHEKAPVQVFEGRFRLDLQAKVGPAGVGLIEGRGVKGKNHAEIFSISAAKGGH